MTEHSSVALHVYCGVLHARPLVRKMHPVLTIPKLGHIMLISESVKMGWMFFPIKQASRTNWQLRESCTSIPLKHIRKTGMVQTSCRPGFACRMACHSHQRFKGTKGTKQPAAGKTNRFQISSWWLFKLITFSLVYYYQIDYWFKTLVNDNDFAVDDLTMFLPANRTFGSFIPPRDVKSNTLESNPGSSK